MDKTFPQLEQELVESKKREENLKKRVSIWRTRALEDRKMLKSLIIQYERIVREQKKTISSYMESAPRLFLLYLHKKYKTWREGGEKKNGS